MIVIDKNCQDYRTIEKKNTYNNKIRKTYYFVSLFDSLQSNNYAVNRFKEWLRRLSHTTVYNST